MKIRFRLTSGKKMILGFIGLVLFVGGGGYVGFSATNTILDYLLTDDPDKSAKIKEEPLKYHGNTDLRIEAPGHGADSD